MSAKQRIVSHLHNFRSQQLGYQNLLSGIFHFIPSLMYSLPNSSTFFIKTFVSILCLCSFCFFKFLQHRIFLLQSEELFFNYSHFNVISFTFSYLGFSCSRACALVTAAATALHSGFGSFGLLAPGIFAIIKSNKGSLMHKARQFRYEMAYPLQSWQWELFLAIDYIIMLPTFPIKS